MTDVSRRNFLKGLGRKAAQSTGEVAQVAGPLLRATSPLGALTGILGQVERQTDATIEVAAPPVMPVVVVETPQSPFAPGPERCADSSELVNAIRAERLDEHEDAILGLARQTARLVPIDDPAGAEAWVDVNCGVPLTDAATPTMQIAHLSAASLALAGTPLAGDGWWILFADTTPIEADPPLSSPAFSAELISLDEAATPMPMMLPMRFSEHLALPRVWHADAQALKLTEGQRVAYTCVRERLAQAQGLVVDEPEHRVLGYPDERTGLMPEECAAVAGAGDWRLLLQVILGDARCLYVWHRAGETDLDHAPLIAFVR